MLFSRTISYPTTGYQGGSPSRAGVVGTIAVHALLIGGYFLIPAEIIETFDPGILITRAIPLPPEPLEQTVEKTAETKPFQKPIDDRAIIPDPTVDFKTADPLVLEGGTSTTIEPIDIKPYGLQTIDPPHTPLFVSVSIDPRYARDFQPDYPPAMQRAQEEGKATVRIIIGPDGRVIAVERIFATTDAFWEATRAQALRKWRFRPATRDGDLVQSEKVMTVHFQLN